MLSRNLLVSAVAAAAAVAWPGCFLPIQDCWHGLSVGEQVDLRLIEPYGPTSRFIWRNVPSVVANPSCGTRDGLGTGTFRFRMASRFDHPGEAGGCAEYVCAPVDPIPSVVVPADAQIRAFPNDGLFGMAIPGQGGCGQWQLLVGRAYDQDPDPFGEVAVPGQLPPVIVLRNMVGSCGTPVDCSDAWVAEINHVTP